MSQNNNAVLYNKSQSVDTDLRNSISQGDIQRVQEIVSAHPEALHRHDEGQHSPLDFAVLSKSVEMVKLLIGLGANVNLPDQHVGMTPFHLAVFNPVTDEMMDCLLQAGADINKKTLDGSTPLLQAIATRSISLCERLIQRGADLQALDDWGRNALHIAVMECDSEQFKFFLSLGVDHKVTTTDGLSLLAFIELWCGAFEDFSDYAKSLLKTKWEQEEISLSITEVLAISGEGKAAPTLPEAAKRRL